MNSPFFFHLFPEISVGCDILMEIKVFSWQIYKFLFFTATDWHCIFFSLTEWRISRFFSCELRLIDEFCIFFPRHIDKFCGVSFNALADFACFSCDPLTNFAGFSRNRSMIFDVFHHNWLRNFMIVFSRLIDKNCVIFLLPISEFCRFYSWDQLDGFRSPPSFYVPYWRNTVFFHAIMYEFRDFFHASNWRF